MLPKNSNISSRCQQVSTRIEGRFQNQLCNITAIPNKSVPSIALKKIQTVYWIGLTIVIGALRKNSSRRTIREILLGRAGVDRCPTPQNQRYPPLYAILLLFLLYFCGIRRYFLQILIVSAYV